VANKDACLLCLLPGPRGPGASKAQLPRGLVGHCTSGRPLNPPLTVTGTLALTS